MKLLIFKPPFAQKAKISGADKVGALVIKVKTDHLAKSLMLIIVFIVEIPSHINFTADFVFIINVRHLNSVIPNYGKVAKR